DFIGIIARATAVAALARAVAALPAEAALAPPVVAVAVTIGLAHHCGGAFLVLVDAHREVAQDVFVEPHLALDLGERRAGRLDVEQGHVGLAVLANPVGQRFHAPILGLRDLAAHL